MRILLAVGAAGAIIAAGTFLTAARSAKTHGSTAAPSYYMQCFGLRTVGNDINAQASQGWVVKAMVDHVSPEGQECVLVLFERGTP